MTAGDDARTPGGWVPTEPPPGDGPADQPPTAAVIEPETQPLTRASIRAAQEQYAKLNSSNGTETATRRSHNSFDRVNNASAPGDITDRPGPADLTDIAVCQRPRGQGH